VFLGYYAGLFMAEEGARARCAGMKIGTRKTLSTG